MRIETGSRLLTLLVILLSAFSAGTFLFANRAMENLRQTRQTHLEASEAIYLYTHGNEMLTRAASDYVLTGNDRFRQAFLARLEGQPTAQVAKRLRDFIGDDPLGTELLDAARENSELRIDLERQAVAKAESGDPEAGSAMLFGSEHRVRETMAAEMVFQIIRQIDSLQRDEVARLTGESKLAGKIAWATMAINVVCMLGTLLGFYRRRVVAPLLSITRQAHHLLAGKRDIHFLDTKSPREAAEILELAEALEDYVRVSAERDTIVDSATSGIALIKDRVIEQANRQLHTITGWSPWDLVGQSTRVWYADDATWHADEGILDEQVWQGETSTRKMQMVRRDGSPFWARLTGRAVDADDRSRGSVWIIDDITVEHTAIEEMRRAQALAEDAARVKSDFLANMSHEIRTPMNSIIGTTHLALKTDPTPRQRDYLRRIQASSQILLGIIDSILDLSKIEAGKMVIEQTEFNLDQVLDNVTNLIAEKAAAKKLELIVHVADDVPTGVIGDPLRLGQVLTNYANNAVKFTEQGEIEISVALASPGDHDVILRFSVRDTGIGLSDEQKSRLFRDFEQADTSITRKYGGTGLGLVIAKQLAELMGGDSGVDSELGRGSTFWFTVRLGRSAAEKHRPQPAPAMRGRRMIVASGCETARNVIGDMLRSMTFRATTVPSGEAAVEEIARTRAAGETYELAFLDWALPGMDGIATAGKIQALGMAPPPRLVIMASQGNDELFEAAEAAGVENVLIKPLSPSLLFDVIAHPKAILREESSEATHAESALKLRMASIAGAHILLVEDNDMNQQMATELLERAGFSVEVADNGRIALEKLGTSEFDIVLMDMQMPEMDGITATRKIRGMPEFRELPIVAMTANAMHGDREKCLAAGMQDHIAKPIKPDQLWHTLIRLVNPRGGIPAGATENPASAPINVGHWFSSTIAGVNTAQGLENAFGDPELYLDVLRKFARGQAKFPHLLAAALNSDDWQCAERLAHTLKGTAATIGAAGIAKIATRLESAIAKNVARSEINAILAEVAPILAETIAALHDCLPAETIPPAPSAEPYRAQRLQSP